MTLSTNYPTLTYTEGDYIIDVVLNAEYEKYGSWLQHKYYGVKHYMFGMAFDSTTLEEFVHTLVNNSLAHYIKNYEQEVIENV